MFGIAHADAFAALNSADGVLVARVANLTIVGHALAGLGIALVAHVAVHVLAFAGWFWGQ